jgi:hypothetical protein
MARDLLCRLYDCSLKRNEIFEGKYAWQERFQIFKVMTMKMTDWRGIAPCSLVKMGSSGSIVSDYGLDDQTIGFRSPAEAEGCFL